jgi:hypothetical protein
MILKASTQPGAETVLRGEPRGGAERRPRPRISTRRIMLVATLLRELMDRAARGSSEDVDFLLGHLTPDATLAATKFVDYALSLVENPTGVGRIEHYLFGGTQMQRNYCSLYFNRRGDWRLVKLAHEQGLIDEIQAYAR